MITNNTIPATIEAARKFVAIGWAPVPVPYQTKGPVINNWQSLRLTDSELPKYFGNGGNIGIILGEASEGLVDIDLDAPEAVQVADAFLPKTGLVHGRKSKPLSHWWYIANPIPKMERFTALDGTCIVELRSTGGQTIIPPSVHPSG